MTRRLHIVEEPVWAFRVYDYDTDEEVLVTLDYDEAADLLGIPLTQRKPPPDPVTDARLAATGLPPFPTNEQGNPHVNAPFEAP